MKYEDIWDIKDDIKDDILEKDGNLEDLIRKVLKEREITSNTLSEMAIRWLIDIFNSESRQIVRHIEKSSLTVYPFETINKLEFKSEEIKKIDKESFTSAGPFSTMLNAKSYEEVQKLFGHPSIFVRHEEVRNFKKWAQDKIFIEWRDKILSSISNREEIENFLENFDWDYAEELRYQRYSETLEILIDMEVQFKFLRLTDNLLNSFFALGDGNEVTWGQATIEQHQQRISLLMGHTIGTIDTIVRHKTAINMIQDKNVNCLSNIVEFKEEKKTN